MPALVHKNRENVNFRNKVWQYVTALVVLLIILNPEMAELALFIDAIGLEMFLMLLKVQVITILSGLFNSKIKPGCIYVKHLCLSHLPIDLWKNIIEKPENLWLAVPSPAMLMNTLVITAAIGIALNVH